jgi:hypothetical protein
VKLREKNVRRKERRRSMIRIRIGTRREEKGESEK